jgi:predicted lipid-binding transport protein (Tim44 family)
MTVNFDGPGPFGGFAHFAMMIVGGLLWLFMLLVVIALIFLLVRFLLVATKAAQIYVAKNSPAVPTEAPKTAAASAPSAPTVSTPAAKAAPKAAPKPRTPKAP